MKKQTNLDSLNDKMFEAIEMLMNNSDETASPNEKIDVETAKVIADLGSVIVDGFKVRAQVMSIISKSGNPKTTTDLGDHSGILSLPNNQ